MQLQTRKKFNFYFLLIIYGTRNFVLFHDTKAAREQPVCMEKNNKILQNIFLRQQLVA